MRWIWLRDEIYNNLSQNIDTDAIFLVDPNNPTGFSLLCFQKKAFQEIIRFCKDKNKLLIFDFCFASFALMDETIGRFDIYGLLEEYGNKFKLNEPDSWNEASQSLEVNDSKLGRVRIRLWENLHFRKTATRLMSLIRVKRLDEKGNLRVSKPLWLAWVGEEMPPLSEVWRLYLRRFTIDHWYRFLKQRLHWTDTFNPV